ncbi:acyltransferase, partial [Leptospira interrogans serovar Pomona]|nr:acyltransferase [Leptospira interrogans serovar Pomona]
MKLFIKTKGAVKLTTFWKSKFFMAMRTFLKRTVLLFLILFCIFISFPVADLGALDPLNSNLSYHPSEVPFVLNVVKILFPEKYEVRKLGTGNHWKIIPTRGIVWMLILREWDGFHPIEVSLRSLLKDLFPNSKDFSFPTLANLKPFGGESTEIVSGTPLIIRYFILEKNEKIVS